LIYFSSELRELKENFTQLKEELDYTRQELARLREGSKHLTEGKTRNITTQANQSSDQENFKLMLNSSQQQLMAVISNVWVQVIKTGRELREETTKLRAAENSSQEEIQRVRDSPLGLLSRRCCHTNYYCRYISIAWSGFQDLVSTQNDDISSRK